MSGCLGLGILTLWVEGTPTRILWDDEGEEEREDSEAEAEGRELLLYPAAKCTLLCRVPRTTVVYC